ncbi:hypothetical protein [Ammoniphilus sp. 3BR4]|uniref:hypothetical protein n=1 Tax=Ammoniphilus sp. 3BR4 TaxID=3158265 RepID=UPI003466A3AB
MLMEQTATDPKRRACFITSGFHPTAASHSTLHPGSAYPSSRPLIWPQAKHIPWKADRRLKTTFRNGRPILPLSPTAPQNKYYSLIQTDNRTGLQKSTLAVSDCFATPMSWSPDGNRIAYLRYEEPTVFSKFPRFHLRAK